MAFPAHREDVTSNVESNGAPQGMVDQIRNADTGRFSNSEEVLQAIRSVADNGLRGVANY